MLSSFEGVRIGQKFQPLIFEIKGTLVLCIITKKSIKIILKTNSIMAPSYTGPNLNRTEMSCGRT